MSDVTYGVGEQTPKRNTKKLLIIGVAAVVLLGVGAYLLFGRNDDKAASTIPQKRNYSAANAPAAPLKPVEVSYVQLSDAELTNKVNFLIGTKQYSEAERLISMQNGLATSKVKLSLLLTVQAAQGKKTEAAATAQKIEALGSLSSGEYMSLARQAEAAGKKQEAINYYKKAIEAYNREKQGNYQDEIDRIETKIKELGQ